MKLENIKTKKVKDFNIIYKIKLKEKEYVVLKDTVKNNYYLGFLNGDIIGTVTDEETIKIESLINKLGENTL